MATGLTTDLQLPYPEPGTGEPANGPAQMKALAEAIEGVRGAPSGLAGLDETGKLVEDHLPERLTESGLATATGTITNVVTASSLGVPIDGISDGTTALQDALVSTAASGTRLRVDGPIRVTGRITLTSNADLDFAPGAELIADSGWYGSPGSALLYAKGTAGSPVALAGNLSAGATVITLPTALASTLAAGDVIGFQSEAIVFESDGHAGEMHRILAVEGTTVTLDTALVFDYLVADSAIAWRIETVDNIRIAGLVITATDPLALAAVRGIHIINASRVTIESPKIINAAGGIFLMNTLDATVNNPLIDRAPNLDNFEGYGVTVGGASANIVVAGLRARYCRHGFTTLGDESSGTSYSGPRNILVVDSIVEGGPSTFSAFDTHPEGINIVFDNCYAYGGTGADANGIQVRARNVTVRGFRAHRCGGRGISVSSSALNATIEGGEVSYCGADSTSGVAVSAAGAIVNGLHSHHNTGPGISVGASGVVISDCYIHENSTYGIHDQGSGTIVVRNLIAKIGGVQTASILSPSAASLIALNVFAGYGVDATGIGGTVASDAVISANTTDGGAAQATRLVLDPGTASQVSALRVAFGGSTTLNVRRASASNDIVAAITAGRKVSLTGGTLELLSTQLYLDDGVNIDLGGGAGSKIGTSTNDRLGFWNATPVARPTAVANATDAASAVTQLNDLLAKLRTVGLIAP